MGPGRISHSLDWECSVKIKNKFFTARHEDCLLLTQREIEIEGLNIAEDDGDGEDVDHQFHNPEPSEVETVQIRQTVTVKRVDPPSVEPTVEPSVDTEENPSSGSDVENQDGDPPFVEPTIVPPAVQPQADGARGRKGKRGNNVARVDVQEFNLKRGTKIEMVDSFTNKWIPVHVNHRVRKGNQRNVEFYNVTISGYDK